MNLVATEIKERLNLSVGSNDVQIIITNNELAGNSHIFETDGLYIISFNSAKINNEKELTQLIKFIRNRIGCIEAPETIMHNNVKRLVEKMDAPPAEKKHSRKTKVRQPKKAAVKKQKIVKPKKTKPTTTKRGRPAGSKNKSNK